MFKKAIAKINGNIDKAMEFRNKMFIRTLTLWGLTGLAYAGHYFDFMSGLCYFLQFIFILISIVPLAIAAFITYVQFVFVSKVEAVSFGGTKTRFVVDAVRDKAIEKVREIKDNKDDNKNEMVKEVKEDKTETIKS